MTPERAVIKYDDEHGAVSTACILASRRGETGGEDSP
jgi:hypothetical protein